MEHLLSVIGNWVVNTIQAIGYPGVVLLMAIESSCIPLPSEIIMPFSGYLVFKGAFNLHFASLAGAFGCLVGSVLTYWIGASGGRPFLEKYGKYVLIRKHDMERADAWFGKYGEWVVFISRILPVIRTFISLPAGVSRMNFTRFAIYSFVGSVPWCYFLTYIGLTLGEHWSTVRRYFHDADAVIGVGLALLFAVWLYHHLRPAKS